MGDVRDRQGKDVPRGAPRRPCYTATHRGNRVMEEEAMAACPCDARMQAGIGGEGVVETGGFEPPTSAVRTLRSPN